MKTGLLVLLGILMMVGLLAGCSRRSYTENDVRKFVLPGTTREAIEQRFGQPIQDDTLPKFPNSSTNVDEILFFMLPPDSEPPREKSGFGGFHVYLKDGKAVKWTPVQEDSY